jgi:hypothetical protein
MHRCCALPTEDERIIGWVRRLWGALKPFTSGAYVNYEMSDEGEDRLRHAYGPEKHKRLVALKNKYDPENLFRLNQNIVPTA